MLTLSGIRKSYGGRVLFDEAGLQVNRGDRIGLVGPNGAGKSTLFRIILGEEVPDAGNLSLQRGTTLGYLPQETVFTADETVLELASAVTSELAALRATLRDAGEACDDESAEVHEARRRLDELDGHRVEARAKHILRGLAFREADFQRKARELSGGWVMRAHLARLLVAEPDLLLLDEPTNHLDLEALLWFQAYLASYPGGILLISHDREFLNQLVGSIVEIRQAKLVRYRGNYEAFLEQREALEEQREAAYKNQQREIARLQRFVDRFRAKNTKASQAQSKLKQIERMERIEAPEGDEATVDFEFPQPERSGQRVVALRGVRQSYGANVVYPSLDFEVERGQRIVLVGSNGAGKSTLLKLLAGVVEPQAGVRQLGHNTKVGYFSQYRLDMLHPERTVLEEGLDTPRRVTELFVRTVLGAFLFRGDDVFKRVSVLSGGEKSRLALVKLLLDPPNLLLLDEPTTHLDIPSTEALLDALQGFTGTIVLISHDVFFIRNLANHVVYVRDGRLTPYPGGYDYYVEKTQGRARVAAAAAATAIRRPEVEDTETRRSRERREQKRLEAEQRQARSRERREQRQKVDRLEQEIHAMEARRADLTVALEDPTTYQVPGRAPEINREFLQLQERLRLLTGEWESAATRLVELEAD